MSELSPQAQAVLDAANGAQCYGPDDVLNDSRWIAAAALRAASEQLLYKEQLGWTGYGYYTYFQNQIGAIADELEKGNE